MKFDLKLRGILAGVLLANLTGAAYADVAQLNQNALSTTAAYTGDSRSYLLALNESNVVIGQGSDSAVAAPVTQPAEFEPPLFSGSNAHKYMGLSTLALVALTAVTAPDDDDEGTTASTTSQTQGTHQSLGRLTAAMAAATVTSGLLAHWDDFAWEDGLTDPDNLHVILGTVGALMMLNAVSVAPGDGHAGSGIAGGAAMAVAIKLTW